jgi:hypothetical protein
MRCPPLVIVPTPSIGTKNPTQKQGQKVESLVLNLVLDKRFQKGFNVLHAKLHVQRPERNIVVKQKVARKKFPRRKETFPLLTTRKPLIVSVEKVVGDGKRDGLRFRRQPIQQKHPLQDDNVELRVVLENVETENDLEVPTQKRVDTMFALRTAEMSHNQIQTRSSHATPPLSLRQTLHLPDHMKNLPVQMEGFKTSPIAFLHG